MTHSFATEICKTLASHFASYLECSVAPITSRSYEVLIVTTEGFGSADLEYLIAVARVHDLTLGVSSCFDGSNSIRAFIM